MHSTAGFPQLVPLTSLACGKLSVDPMTRPVGMLLGRRAH